jgi:hypothetical protein
MDEHVPPAVASGLRQRGVDVLTTQDAGMFGSADDVQLAYAAERGRVVFTQDADFPRLHAAGMAHSGIVYAPYGTSIGTLVRGMMEISTILDAADIVNWIEFL